MAGEPERREALIYCGKKDVYKRQGFRTSTVEYERKERLAGESKYPLKDGLASD